MLNTAQRLLDSWWPKRERQAARQPSSRGYGRLLVEGAGQTVYHFKNHAARMKVAADVDLYELVHSQGLAAAVQAGKVDLRLVKLVEIKRAIFADRTRHHPQRMRDDAKLKGVGGPRHRRPPVAANDDTALRAAS
jgi:hypothetical protein